METKLSHNELLLNFIRKANNPFTTVEQKIDIRRVLETSSLFNGENHLFLVICHFDNNPLFSVTEEQAIRQAYLALDENCLASYYYLYKLFREKDESKARSFLIFSCDTKNPKAYIEMAKLRHDGILFEKNREEARKYFRLASECGIEDGFFGLLLMACEDGDYDEADRVYRYATIRGYNLPGVAR